MCAQMNPRCLHILSVNSRDRQLTMDQQQGFGVSKRIENLNFIYWHFGAIVQQLLGSCSVFANTIVRGCFKWPFHPWQLNKSLLYRIDDLFLLTSMPLYLFNYFLFTEIEGMGIVVKKKFQRKSQRVSKYGLLLRLFQTASSMDA